MTLQETRQLGIEFERRVQTMIPQKELVEKLDTETIYSFLNQYQQKYIKDIYLALDNIDQTKNISKRLESILRQLIRTKTVDPEQTEQIGTMSSVTYKLEDDFGLYIDSNTLVDNCFKLKSTQGDQHPGILHNNIVQYSTLKKFMQSPYDSMRILRNPVAAINGDSELLVLYDRYTIPTQLNISYYALPKYFDIMTSTACELPYDAFDDIVSGALELYVQYVAGAEAMRKRQIKAEKEEKRRAERRKNNNTEEEE